MAKVANKGNSGQNDQNSHHWFFQISGIFPTCFACFLPANTTNKIIEL